MVTMQETEKILDELAEELPQDFYRELCTYTSPAYSTETRQMAFEYLKEAFPFTDQCLKDLIKATR